MEYNNTIFEVSLLLFVSYSYFSVRFSVLWLQTKKYLNFIRKIKFYFLLCFISFKKFFTILYFYIFFFVKVAGLNNKKVKYLYTTFWNIPWLLLLCSFNGMWWYFLFFLLWNKYTNTHTQRIPLTTKNISRKNIYIK